MKKTILCLLSLILSFSFLVPGLADESVLTEYEQEKYDLFVSDVIDFAGKQLTVADDAGVPSVEEKDGMTTITLTPFENVHMIFQRNDEDLESVTLYMPYESSADTNQAIAVMFFTSTFSETERSNKMGQRPLTSNLMSNPGMEYEQDGLTFVGETGTDGSDLFMKMTVTGDFTN